MREELPAWGKPTIEQKKRNKARLWRICASTISCEETKQVNTTGTSFRRTPNPYHNMHWSLPNECYRMKIRCNSTEALSVLFLNGAISSTFTVLFGLIERTLACFTFSYIFAKRLPWMTISDKKSKRMTHLLIDQLFSRNAPSNLGDSTAYAAAEICCNLWYVILQSFNFPVQLILPGFMDVLGAEV